MLLPAREPLQGACPIPTSNVYSAERWEAEVFGIYGLGAPPPLCPECDRRGFYGPRYAEPDRRYRACKFCGFWQDIDQPPVRYRPCVHHCRAWPDVAGAPYLWWVAPGRKSFRCPWCRRRARVHSALRPAPSDDENHPWWKVRQRVPQRYYMKFWARWPSTVGRVYL